jgi:hypothetical protein
MATIQSKSETTPKISVFAVAAMTVVAYLLAQFIHEGLGHGGMAIGVGARITQVTNTYMQYDPTGVSDIAVRAIASGGTLANVIVGVLILWLLRNTPIKSANMRFFFWLLGHINLFKGFGYLLITFAPIGDWHDVVNALPSQPFWIIALTLLGALTSLGTFFYAARTLDEFIGKDKERRQRAFTLTLFPYLLGGTVNILATVIGLGVTDYTFTAALATFGGTFLMVWLGLAVGHPKQNTPVEPATPFYDIYWLSIGSLAVLFYLFWFGSGLIR